MSTDPHQDRIDELFQQAKNLSAAEQARFVDRACRDDPPELRQALEQLLAADQQQRAHAPTGEHVGMGFKLGPQARDSLIGRRLGAYEVKRFLSKGGFGNVYLGERTDNFRQKVALKLIRPDWVSDPTVLLRFEQERQALADLRHEYIASLLDGGTTEEGWPFLVMEYVDGLPITDYCKEKALPIEGRLDLFQKVCQAVQHAHNHFYLHRDIKPSNILVTADGVPKLLDFGIAKLFDPLSRQRQVSLTRDHMPLTVEYASPEQIRADRKELSTASDVYSLGVVLYELLTGRLPLNFRSYMHAELIRVACEEEPETPAAVVSKPIEQTDRSGKPITTSPDEVSRQRGTSTRGLRKALLGDLELIVLHALKKEPQRRYPRPEDFARDLDNLRRGMPVAARPDSRLYRAQKFLRRHRAACITLSGIALTALVLGSVSAVFAYRRNLAEAGAKVARERGKQVSQASRAARQLSKSPPNALLLAATAVETGALSGNVALPFSEQVLRDSVTAVRGVPLPGAAANIQQIVVSPDSSYVAALCTDDIVRCWQPADIRPPLELPARKQWHFGTVEFLAGNQLLACLDRGGTRSTQLACTTLGRPGLPKPVIRACEGLGSPWVFDRGRRWAILPGQAPNQIRLAHGGSNERLDSSLIETEFLVKSWTLSADGSQAAAGGNEGQIKVWRLTENGSVEVSRVSIPEKPLVALVFSAEGVLQCATPQSLWRWHLGEQNAERLCALPGPVNRLEQIAGDGCLIQWSEHVELANTDASCGLAVWSSALGSAPRALNSGRGATGDSEKMFVSSSVRLSSSGRWLVARTPSSQCLQLWDMSAFEKGPADLLSEGRASAHSYSAFARNETWLAVGTETGPIQLWELQLDRPPRLIETLIGHEHPISALAFDPAGGFLVSGSRAGKPAPGVHVEHPGQVRVWDLSDGSAAPIHPHRLHLQPRANRSLPTGAKSIELTFSHDGKCIAVTDDDSTFRIWPALRGDSDAFSPGPLAEFHQVHLSAPDAVGGWVFSSAEGLICWSPATGERRISSPPASIPLALCAGKLPDTPQFAALCQNGELLLFDDHGQRGAYQIARGPLLASDVKFLKYSKDGHPLVVLANHGTFLLRAPNNLGSSPERPAMEGAVDRMAASETALALAQGNNVRLLTIDGRALDLASVPAPVQTWGHLEFLPKRDTILGLNELGAFGWNTTDPKSPPFKPYDGLDANARSLAVGEISSRLAIWLENGSIIVTGVPESSEAPPVSLPETPKRPSDKRQGESSEACFLSYALEDRLLIASDYASGELHVWAMSGLQDNQQPVVLEPSRRDFENKIDAIALSTQRDRVAVAFADGAVYVWNLRLEDLVTLARRLAGRDLDGREKHALSSP